MHPTPDEAQRFLKNVRPEQHLKLHLGSDVRNLSELAEMLDIMTESTFRHHVSSGKNDFADWIRKAVKDTALASEIQHMKTRNAIEVCVQRRVKELEEALEQDKVPVHHILRQSARDFALGAVIGFLIGMVFAYFI